MMPRHVLRAVPAVTAALLAVGTTAACGDDAAGAGGGDRVEVVAAFYPLQFVAERVGGAAVTVRNLTKPGVEPHDLELNPQQVGEVSEAALVVYLAGFQPAVDEAVAQQAADRALDVATVEPLLAATAGGHAYEDDGHADEPAEAAGQETGDTDPHVWLDPTRLATIGDRLAERLAEIDPAHAADYPARAAALRGELAELDREYARSLADCDRREIVTSHTAFGYLAARYDLDQIGITGLTPESEPAPQRVAAVTEEAREHGATTIFFETLVSPKLAETIAREVGARTAVLDPLEGLPDGGDGDYLSGMRANLAALTEALGCR